MKYRKNEKGRYEGVTDRGEIIRFDDAEEMVAFSKLRREIAVLLGYKETVEIERSVSELFLPCEQVGGVDERREKTVKFCIHTGVYDPSELLLINEKALA